MAKQTEPKIGDTRIRYSKAGVKIKETLIACVQCGKGRWQVYRTINDRPICRSCSLSNGWKNPELRAKHIVGSVKRWAVPNAKAIMSEQMMGESNHFYGKKHTKETLTVLRKPHIKRTVTPTWNWGYFIGVVLGDGCISKTNGGNFKISVGSTKTEIVDLFYNCVKNLRFNCGYEITKINSELKENTLVHSDADTRYNAVLQSKSIYLWLRPYKYEDFHFTVPDVVYRHDKMLRGFLCGFFDAEGGVYKSSSINGYTINCFSKHKDNLEQIKDCLDILGINSYIHVRTDKYLSKLMIANYKDRVLFRELVNFKIKRKSERLDQMKKTAKNRYSREIKEYALKLIREGKKPSEIKKLTKVNRITIGVWRWNLNNPRKDAIVSSCVS